MKRLLMIAFVGLLSGCATSSSPSSARHYLGLLDLREANFTWDKYRLLDRPEVQRDLLMSADQLASLKKTWNAKTDEIPELKKMLAAHKAEMSDTNLTSTQRAEIRERGHAEFMRILDSHNESALPVILNPRQLARLRELLIQMRGPAMIFYDPSLQKELGITAEQKDRLKETMDYYAEDLSRFQRRYGRQQINSRPELTMSERVAELDALALATEEIFKDRDHDLLVNLTDEQEKRFQELQGKPLGIKWPKHDTFFVGVFEQEK